MASQTTLLLLMQTALLLMLALSWSMEGVQGEEEDLSLTMETPKAPRRSLFVRRQLWEDGYGGYGGGRQSSCEWNREVCEKSPYPRGWKCCGSRCTELQTDSNNCGWCGHRCGWSETCCSGECVSLSSDTKNCGRCGEVCPYKDECKYGVCKYDSPYEYGHGGYNSHSGNYGNHY